MTVLAVTIAAPAAAVAAPAPETANNLARSALVIGNADYSGITPLQNPTNDSHDMCAALRALNYQVSCVNNIRSRAELRAVLQDFSQSLSDNRIALVYYAGHAMQINGENYLVPTDAHFDSSAGVAAQSVPVTYLMKQLQATVSPLKIVIIDACRDELPQAGAGATAPLNVTFFPDDSFVLYSTADNERAMDGRGRNGLLTKHLLAHVRDPGDLDDLFNKVVDGVRTEAESVGYRQVPEVRRNSSLRFCQVKCTELEDLQTREEQSDKQIQVLQRQLDAGDRNAQAQIDAALKERNALKKREEQLARKRHDLEQKSRVIPSF